jgi:exodeoxyribonuclease V alpha subunit
MKLASQNIIALFGDLERRFADLLVRLAGGDSAELVAAACLASQATSNGDVCVELNTFAGLRLPGTDVQLPALADWLAGLFASGVVGRPGDYRPLIIDDQARLYLYRYWDYERRVAEHLRRRAQQSCEVDETLLQAGLARLFADPQEIQQKIAAAVAVLRRLCVISGGPGTGKTTTVVKILLLLAEQAHGRPPLRVALAAPTGKAAARARDAVHAVRDQLHIDAGTLASLPSDATTLHRLLGVQPGSAAFRYHRANPLPVDAVVVDEASMVDLALLAKLLDALPAHARLLLLGDKDQLASVEAGAVLGEICAATGFTPAFAARLAVLVGAPVAAGADFPLGNSIALLDRSYRFDARSAIGKLAQLVNQGNGQAALALLRDGAHGELLWEQRTDTIAARLAERLKAWLADYWRAVRTDATPADVLHMFDRSRVLCAHRDGPASASEVNRIVERDLVGHRQIDARHAWYAGRPVMIMRNDYELELFNGDIGIALPDNSANGELRVFFPTAQAGLRPIHPARLPEHETVYAMTIHKSQGSEFEEVLILLPVEPSPIASRELLYTAVTRARTRVEIWASEVVLLDTVARKLSRASGLRNQLIDAGN